LEKRKVKGGERLNRGSVRRHEKNTKGRVGEDRASFCPNGAKGERKNIESEGEGNGS